MTAACWKTLAAGWGVTLMVFALFWVVQQLRRNAALVDVGWSVGIGLLALFYAVTVAEPLGITPRRLLITTMICLWSFRLAGYLAFRLAGQPEDARYAALRTKWGPWAAVGMFVFFLLQGLTVIFFSLAPLAAMISPRGGGLDGWDALAVVIWLAAVGGEALADGQLAHFKAAPSHRGQTCRAGLWRYSRHPNYFFEWVHWWAYIPAAIGSRWWWWPPIIMASMWLVLRHFTGIPATEARAVERRGEDYRRYQREVNAFFPWKPRVKQPPDSSTTRSSP